MTRYEESSKPIPEIARELGVDALLEGSLSFADGKLRIAVQLIRASPEELIWAKSFERSPADVPSLQGELARSVTRELKVAVTADESARLAKPPSVNPRAFDAFLRAFHCSSRMTREGLEESLGHLRFAVKEDPDFALAYCAMTFVYANSWWIPAVERHSLAKAAALKAIELDETLGDSHGAMGIALSIHEWDWAGVERETSRALELKPGDAYMHLGQAIFLGRAGRFEEAIAATRLAQRLAPADLGIKVWQARLHYLAREYEEAVSQSRSALQLNPNLHTAREPLAWSLMMQSRYEKALSEFEKAVESDPENPDYRVGVAFARAKLGRPSESARMLRHIETSDGSRNLSAFDVATLYIGLGQRREALDWLEKAYRNRADPLTFAKVDPVLDPLRSEPRFQDLLQRMKLPN